MSGSIDAAVSAPVRVVRDSWGVPHIFAETTDDLFFAQGFVQAQDRLFQLDLWRRAVQGRLAEVLGPNFAERDASTRRMQYRGDADAEWASYGPDARAIATAFVGGVNAWVSLARERPPEEFVIARWKPELWSPADLLNRTDAFVTSGNALDEVARGRLNPLVAEAIRRVGTRPFFAGFSTPAAERLDHPSPHYLVHLRAPGWNVIGATAAWRPGVAIGHNDRIAWESAPAAVDTQDIFTEKAAPIAAAYQDVLVIRGRKEPFEFAHEFTRHGVIVASDREHDTVFTLRWSGVEVGGAPELGALAVDRAQSWAEFREALARWKMPARRFEYQDVDGNRGFQVAALVPVRRGSEWAGWLTLDQLPHGFTPAGRATRAPQTAEPRPAARGAVVFGHPLGITEPLRQRFHVGPLTPTGDPRPFYIRFDSRDWDRTRAINAPGQSGSPASGHFSDLAKLWASGDSAMLVFSDEAIRAHTESTLTLTPRRSRP